MKIRDSGMPDEGMWETFFDPTAILLKLRLAPSTGVIVDMGCGYGTFAIPAAQLSSGVVYAFDIEPAMLAACRVKAEALGLSNVITVNRDFIDEGTGLEDGTADYCMLFNIMHTAEPLSLLREARRILQPGGRVSIIHWNHDPATPRGPLMAIRPTPEQVMGWIQAAGFTGSILTDLPPYHYGIIANR